VSGNGTLTNGKKRKRTSEATVDTKRSKLKPQQPAGDVRVGGTSAGAEEMKTDNIQVKDEDHDAMDVDPHDDSEPPITSGDAKRILLVLQRCASSQLYN
jgi:hypothetical protein